MKKSELTELINRRYATWFETNELLTWNMSQFAHPLLPFRLYGCRMSGFGSTSVGYGTSWNGDEAAHKSFAEAWERLWLVRRNLTQRDGQQFTSNGFAAGLTAKDAIESSRQEAIERAVLLKAWTEKAGWLKSRCYSMRSYPLAIYLNLSGWTVSFFTLRSNIGFVRACLLRHSSKGAFFDSSFATSFASADQKLLLSVFKNVLLEKPKDSGELPEIGGPGDHEIFYSSPNNLAAFDFLNCDLDTTEIFLENPEGLETELISDEVGFPAVARSSHPSWIKLSWGKHSIKGKNPWPHPLV